jgi:hypothetical protein
MDFVATDILDLNAIAGMSAEGVWKPQTHTSTPGVKTNQVKDGNGDVDCISDPYGQMDTITVTYEYCPLASPAAGLGAALALILLGNVQNGFVITSIAISTSNNGALSVAFTAHNHDDNPHSSGMVNYSLPAALVTIFNNADPLNGAIDFFSKSSAGTVGTQSSTLTFSCEHDDQDDGAGDHDSGQNSEGKIEASVEYTGSAAVTLPSPWTESDGSGAVTQNNGTASTSSKSGVQFVTRN